MGNVCIYYFKYKLYFTWILLLKFYDFHYIPTRPEAIHIRSEAQTYAKQHEQINWLLGLAEALITNNPLGRGYKTIANLKCK